MKPFISSKTQGVIAYILGILLASSPWTCSFSNIGGAAFFLPLCAGCMLTLMALFTVTGGAIKVFPIATHLTLATFAGFLIMVSPFLWGFSGQVWLPHTIIGFLIFAEGIFSQHSPFTTDELHVFDARGM